MGPRAMMAAGPSLWYGDLRPGAQPATHLLVVEPLSTAIGNRELLILGN